nr:RNA-directed DNA polymerase, eukaryota [Tanacetum cinerariifolium]
APRGGAEEDHFIQLVDLVDSITISNSNDRWVWLLDSSGEFSVHSARTYIDDLLLPTTGSPTRWMKSGLLGLILFSYLKLFGRRLQRYVVVDLELSQPGAFWNLPSAYGSPI